MRGVQVIFMREFGALLVIFSLAISATLSAPSQQQPQISTSASSSSQQQQQQQQQQNSNNLLAPSLAASSSIPRPISSSSSSITSSSSSSAASGANGQQQSLNGSSSSPLPADSSVFTNSPPIVSLKSQQQHQQPDDSTSSNLDTFDGRNSFSDDSLWQIPVHLVRDLSTQSNGADSMVKSASETPTAASNSAAASSRVNNNNYDENNINDDDDQDDAGDADDNNFSFQQAAAAGAAFGHQNQHQGPATLHSTSNVLRQQQALVGSIPAAPTVISASSSNAAGYQYPSSSHLGQYYGRETGGYIASPSYGHQSGHYSAGGDHYGGKYFQYASVPYPYAWEFGYRRGNPYHTIERYEHGKGPHFQTKVKWSDKYGGYGVHVWDYNHDDHHAHHYGGDSYGPSGGGGHHYGAATGGHSVTAGYNHRPPSAGHYGH